jgi:two-component system response regulator NreC
MSLTTEKPFVAPPERRWVRHTSAPLTDRERQVLTLVAQGYTNWEVGGLLGLSPKTVEAHRAHILNKLGLRRRVELVQYALREGYLTPEPW